MKITKEHVGKKVRGSDWKNDDYIRVIAVGETHFFGEHVDLGENLYKRAYSPSSDWELLPDPKPQGAPAFYKRKGTICWCVSNEIFEERGGIGEYYSLDKFFVSWPALLDPNTGMYTLPEVE